MFVNMDMNGGELEVQEEFTNESKETPLEDN